MISITVFIIAITSIASVAAFYNQKLLESWILNPYAVSHQRQWHRMFTSGLLHADFMHLAINMLVLYMFGTNLESYFKYMHGESGTLYYLLLYFAGVIVANISSVVKHKENPAYNALGASGATSALVFAFIVLAPLDRSVGILFIPPGVLPNIVFGVLYLLYCVYMAKRGQDNIGHEAHFYGALWGALFMFIAEEGVFLSFVEQLTNF